VSLNKVKEFFKSQNLLDDPAQSTESEQQIIEDLTVNEHYRLMRVIHGKINLDPLYEGFRNIFNNIVDSNNSYLPQSVN
jgi:hypothetical protein